MRTMNGLKRMATAAAMAAGLHLWAAMPASATETISQFGYWSAVADADSDGRPICGVRTQMTNGAELRLIVLNNAVHLVAHDPAWRLRRDGQARVAINVDGEVYRGTAQVADAQTLVVESLSTDFLAQFMDGNTMVADFGGVRWSVNLIGSGPATSAMGQCVATARRLFLS